VSFLAPERLWLLALLPMLAALYVVMQRRRRARAVRFTNLELLAAVAPHRPGWRRHLVAAGLLASLGLLVVAFARPLDEVRVPRERATIVLAVDVSLSMQATDVDPTRLAAAQAAASRFVEQLPRRLNLGLVAFSGSGRVLVPPTTDRQAVLRALDALELSEYTAIGEAIFTSLDAVRQAPVDPANPDAPVPAAIVLLSDGETTVGRPDSDGAAAAARAGVPVSTIAFGTPDGTVEIGGVTQPVPVDEEALRAIADATGGRAYTAQTADQLADVYADIGSDLGYVTEEQEVTARWAGIALVVLLGTAAASLAASGRLP
jgi:Ca-activated chloride channel family protein